MGRRAGPLFWTKSGEWEPGVGTGSWGQGEVSRAAPRGREEEPPSLQENQRAAPVPGGGVGAHGRFPEDLKMHRLALGAGGGCSISSSPFPTHGVHSVSPIRSTHTRSSWPPSVTCGRRGSALEQRRNLVLQFSELTLKLSRFLPSRDVLTDQPKKSPLSPTLLR